MKWLLGISLFLSVSLNIYLIYDDVRISDVQAHLQLLNSVTGRNLTNTNWRQGLDLFQNKLKEKKCPILGKKYYYINIWTNWCSPCIKEMPWLDSIAGSLNKDVGYVFLTDLNDHTAYDLIKKRDYHLKNFVLLNEMSDFVSAICNEMKRPSKTYPMVLILSNDGKLLHFSTGAYTTRNEASEFAKLINSLE